MGLPHVSHIHSNIFLLKFSQAFKIADFNQGPDHELVAEYWVRSLV